MSKIKSILAILAATLLVACSSVDCGTSGRVTCNFAIQDEDGKSYDIPYYLSVTITRSIDGSDTTLINKQYAISSLNLPMSYVGESDTYTSTLRQPIAVGLGLALERNERWEIDLDGYYSPLSGLEYREDPRYNLFGVSALRTAPNYRVALGGEWKGNPSATSYWGRIGITAGLYHNRSKLNLQINGTADATAINETGCGMAFKLPMRKGRSLLTLGIAYSSIGTIDLLRRDVITFGISIGSCERWFVKRKYD